MRRAQQMPTQKGDTRNASADSDFMTGQLLVVEGGGILH